ncbi:related to MBP1 - transcription factor, subunit of the MBF factor [Melanopsichium pennsylvanicum]|uniref:Related to MBP1 - transcription factor, subunit of the MBF factor n=2 Tax=Melanopsichium pennsylvanicum TaxID=63383 RepID=A0AAJ4XSW5_9BASI|nr:related to MBP1-transcription factor, subunit of the MBF factor [Melanopsichium pennsylvanicum 4]SNX87955.1 related to MBP1 - transcription factor, subunit of the MBF factor [Melanopsichium pennsylvanicum]
MSGDKTIFKATYSGVPVYECIINTVAVMRRRSDSWLNATQILKVVGLDKPQRTRVLEREIQKGIHEKVQGGYGKYQGTWIPLDVAIELAERYNILDLLQPITSYVPSAADSPPPAPKHTISTSNRTKKVVPVDAGALGRSRRATSIETESEVVAATQQNASEGTMSPSPSDISSSSRTPSPLPVDRANALYANQAAGFNGREVSNQARYADIILDYFVTENTTVPSLLINPPPDFNPNMSIDDDEHTALHWACAMGRIRVVKLLLSAGADIFRVNTNQQTALMRATMFSNNYDLRKFPELFELLHRSILNIDRNDRTVFHHVVDLALSRGKPHAARYYMETMINRLADYGDQLADILNFQDDEGETPLTMAARARSKRLVRLLLEHGADPKIRNKEGKNAEDYIVEDERFRSSPSRNAPAGIELGADGLPVLPTSSLHTSEAGQRTAGRAVTLMSNLLHSLADSYDSEINTAEKKLTQAHGLLKQIQTEIEDSAKVAEGLYHEAKGVEEERKKVDSLQLTLKQGINKRTREDLESRWNEGKEAIKRARTQAGLEAGALLASNVGNAQEGGKGADAQRFLRGLPAGTDVKTAIDELKKQLKEVQKKRSDLVWTFVNNAREQGTGKTMAAYRRLIAAGCGGIAPDEVDAVVGVLCELLQEGHAGAENAGKEGDERARDAAMMLKGAGAAALAANAGAA